ncbi:MAG TPA: response regulator [Anaerolineales bacterium]|jgi:CheY-like chemotaxis protein|nr:response regulator [Anaerolineales bacterium]
MKTILIVEDIELNIDLLTQILEEDYNILTARDGAEGVTLTKQNKPDLVLMDISLPVMDGYEATRKIRQTFPSLPVIGLSAHAMQGDDEKAKTAGCTDYLTKPVDEDLLRRKMKQYLGESHDEP